MGKKFNPKKLEKLNNPNRLKNIPPDYIWDKLKLSGCKTIVDIGAGTGLFSKEFSKLMENGEVYALDISELMIQWIENNVSNSYANIKPILMSESEIPLNDEFANLVLMITLHHELDSPEIILKEALRVLKKDGKVCIIDWKKEEMSMGPTLEIRCSIEDISKQLIDAGFSNIHCDNSLDMFNLIIAEK